MWHLHPDHTQRRCGCKWEARSDQSCVPAKWTAPISTLVQSECSAEIGIDLRTAMKEKLSNELLPPRSYAIVCVCVCACFVFFFFLCVCVCACVCVYTSDDKEAPHVSPFFFPFKVAGVQ